MNSAISKYWFLIPAIVVLVGLFSCEEDLPVNIESDDGVQLMSIKIVNAGGDGGQVVQGVVDEVNKTVSFPRLDTLTDFSNLRFEAEMSPGATLDQESYDVGLEDGQAEKTMVIKVVNNKRFREYLVTIRLLVPVYGADFNEPEIYDNTNNDLGNPVYPTFVSLLTRGTGFDGEHVLIVTRAEGGSHLLSVDDLRQNKVEPIPLNMTGVAGGTFPINVGAQVNGHTYIASLSGSHASPFRIYHWTDPSAEPEVVADILTGDIPDVGSRHGDNMSVNLDEDGNGYMYFGDNAVTTILRLTVTGYTTISDPVVLANAPGSSFVMSFNQIGQSSNYLFTGYEAPLRVANESGVISYQLNNDAIPLRSSDARIVNFNGERYLITTTAARSGSDAVVMYIYDITKGSDAVEALKLFNERADKSAVFQYSLLGPTNAAPGTQTGWHITKDVEGKDETLTIYAAS
ncbi:MAG: DUF4623 domain-containing protein, partial [Fibrobacter sp.]|nr:DUF4623 domain-containing protein [Fibrobacter sp.]